MISSPRTRRRWWAGGGCQPVPRDSAERLLEALAPGLPELVGGQTELGPGRGPPVTPGSFSGRQVHYGPREHGMAACLNGLALHGGVLPYAVAPLAATDSMRPALRLSAMMGLRAIHVATHDSIGLGADGAAYQPIEQLAGLRAIPGLLVLRPADPVEAAECCELAVRRTDGPSLLVLCEQPVPGVAQRCGREPVRPGRLRPRRSQRATRRHPDRQRKRGIPRDGGA